MDACFLRFLGPELVRVLAGVRIDTVFSPSAGFWTVAFSPPVALAPEAEPCWKFLLVRSDPRLGSVFLSAEKPVNPAIPPAKAMWLRKRLKNRRIIGGETDWPRRRLALELSPGEGRWLLLSMEDDPVVLDRLPDGFHMEPSWTDAREAASDPVCPRSLRRAMERAGQEEYQEVLEDFQSGRTYGFYLGDAAKQAEGPLPWPSGRVAERFGSALEAAGEWGRRTFFAALAPVREDPAKAEKRVKKRLAVLDRDRQRLEDLVERQRYGEALAASLSLLDPKAKSGPMDLEHPEQGLMTVPLDPAFTIMENMERFFQRAAKGRRGLKHVERLEVEALEGRMPPGRQPREPKEQAAGNAKGRKEPVPLHRFRSSDGFMILRGKNSAANHKLLSHLASPFDFWLHAEGGPGAHVIVKRDHPGHEVPDTSIREAAVLAALASHRASDSKADVLLAQVREVRKIKGAALGQVRLSSARTVRVDLDPSLEERLRLSD